MFPFPRVAAVASGLLVALAVTSTTAQTVPVVHIGIGPFEAQADPSYAQEIGAFKRFGLKVEIQQFTGGAAVIAAIVGGSLEIGGGNPLPLAIARQHGVRVLIVAPGSTYDSAAGSPLDALAVAARSPYRTGTDLNGKTLAVVGIKSAAPLAALSWIDQNGGDSTTVKTIELPMSGMSEALAEGRIDAAEMADPALAAGIAAGKIRIIGRAYDAIAKRQLAAAWFASDEWAARNADTIRRFTAAINEASAWAVRNPDAAGAILRRTLKVEVTRAHEYHSNALDPGLIQPLLDAAVKYKLLDRPMNADEIIWRG